ncbi:CPBP family intramembrane glutamic endopeptidase [uncultured Marinococcus sp.]|uniref:CPBP family intramembrane glutamic endopeptidase n=1 Tax=uncultured Marinococcus sp. TaxID=487012 RepID=UPI00262AE225|nr:CPBP family intramembrane glutamic endopeptidase [uncultured Marinococcus sp.]
MMKHTKQGVRAVPAEVPYHRVLVSSKRRILRGLLAFLLLIGGMYLFVIAFSLLGREIDIRVFGRVNPAGGGNDYTPVYMASNFLAIAMLIPWSMFIQRWLYGMKGSVLHSVRSIFRPDVFGRAVLLILPIMTVCLVIFNWFAPYTTTTWNVNDLLVIFALSVLIVPLQSAGEEYGFRGLVFQIASSWVRSPRASLVTGITVSSILFASIHLSPDPWFNLYYMVLGVTFALLTWRTGGLEYAIVIHAANNALTYVLATVLRTDLLADVDRSAGMTGSKIILLPSIVIIFITIVVCYQTRRKSPELTPGSPYKENDQISSAEN